MCQQNARITVRESNGSVSKTSIREFKVTSDNDVQEVLREMGVIDSQGNVKEGVDVEVEMLEGNGRSSNSQSLLSITPGFSERPPSACQAYLGVVLKKNTKTAEAAEGALVTEVEPLSPANKSGILAGDIIYQIDKKEIGSPQDAIIYIRGKCQGDKVKIYLLRGGKRKKLEVELTEKSVPQANIWGIPQDKERGGVPDMFGSGQERAFLGVTPSESVVPSGACVRVVPGSAAEAMGIMDNDVITEVNGNVILAFSDISNMVASMKPNDPLEVVVNRDGKVKKFSGNLGSKLTGGSGDFRYFFDDKGLDEGGLSIMDFEFDMDMNDLQRQLEQMMKEFNPPVNPSISQGKIRIEDVSSNVSNLKGVCSNAPDLNFFSLSIDANTGDVILSIHPVHETPLRIELLDEQGEVIFLEERKITSEYIRSMEIVNQSHGRYFVRISQGDACLVRSILKSEE
jgi:hypothetical protein